MSPTDPEYVPVEGSDAKKDPVRLLLVQGEARPPVDVTDEPLVMTFPHLLVRELIAFLGISVALVGVSLFFNAPLEEIADPTRTPNPAKAPWYFLGLQELLHYYPPVISGVLLPGILLVSLAIVPYFRINVERPPLWQKAPVTKLALLWAVIGGLTIVFLFTGGHAVWPVIGPLWFVGVLMSAGAHPGLSGAWGRWLRTRSLPYWIFLWFLLSATVLTLVGIFFRGPGWIFTLPWRDGIFY